MGIDVNNQRFYNMVVNRFTSPSVCVVPLVIF